MEREHIMGRKVFMSGKRTHYGKGGVSEWEENTLWEGRCS